jgi:Helix-turn-helix domain
LFGRVVNLDHFRERETFALGVPERGTMHSNQQLWLSWSRGEITDDDAQAAAETAAARRQRRYVRYIEASEAAAEAAHARKAGGRGPAADRPPSAPAAISAARGGAREKVFGPGRCVPLDRNAKVRVMMLARALSRRQEKGKAYGEITAKALAVLQALLWRFHNAATGKCFPSYEAIAEAAGCARSTVYEAIRALEQVGVLSWVNRIKRVREYVPGLFGKGSAWRWRVIRTSNSYVLTDPLASKSDFPTGTLTQGVNQEKLLQNVDHLDRRDIRPGGGGRHVPALDRVGELDMRSTAGPKTCSKATWRPFLGI